MVHCRLLNVHTLFRFALIAGTVLILPTLAAAGNAVPSSADWLGLRMCESHNQYAENTHNGYYGAYQFSMRAWESVGGTGRPDLSTPAE